MTSTSGRRVVVPLTNKSGGSVAAGDVVIVDTGNNDAFTTTTSAGYTGTVGVAQETIANNATGRVCISGYVALVNVNASVTRGNYGKTHTVAKQATDMGATRATGAAMQFLTGGTTPDAVLFGLVDSGVGGSLTDHTHAATGSGANGGGNALDVNAGSLRIPVGTSSLTTTEGYLGYESTKERLRLYDGQRERTMGIVGWAPRGLPMGYDNSAAYSTAAVMAANGGSLATAMLVVGHLLLEQVRFRSTDTSTQRTWGWDLYEQRLNNGNSGENTLDRVANSTADETFTPSAASIRTIAAASAPVYIPPGIYWLVIQNRHASNSLGIGTTAPAGFNFGAVQFKTTTNPNGATLDFVAATWTQNNAITACVLDGRVFGQTTAYPA